MRFKNQFPSSRGRFRLKAIADRESFGPTKSETNGVSKSGRGAVWYICTTAITQVNEKKLQSLRHTSRGFSSRSQTMLISDRRSVVDKKVRALALASNICFNRSRIDRACRPRDSTPSCQETRNSILPRSSFAIRSSLRSHSLPLPSTPVCWPFRSSASLPNRPLLQLSQYLLPSFFTEGVRGSDFEMAAE